MPTFSQRLKQLQSQNNYLKKDISAKVGISTMAYHRYEKGDRVPPADILINFSNFYDVSIDYLLGLTDNPKINK